MEVLQYRLKPCGQHSELTRYVLQLALTSHLKITIAISFEAFSNIDLHHDSDVTSEAVCMFTYFDLTIGVYVNSSDYNANTCLKYIKRLYTHAAGIGHHAGCPWHNLCTTGGMCL